MRNYRFLAFFLVAFFVLGLTACEMSASTPPPSSDDAAEQPAPDVTSDVMDLLLEAKQTTEAESGGEATEDSAAPGEDDTSPGAATEEDEATASEAETESAQEDAADPEPEIVAPEFDIPSSYTVRAGEFPYCIARRFDISPNALLNANGLSGASMVYPGTVLTIPKNAGSFNAGPRSLRAHPVKYTILAGDTVYYIACLFGDVDPRAIEEVNGLTGAYTLGVGQVIQIP